MKALKFFSILLVAAFVGAIFIACFVSFEMALLRALLQLFVWA